MLIIIHIEINYVHHDTDGLIFMIDEQHRTADRVVIMLNIARGVREHMQVSNRRGRDNLQADHRRRSGPGLGRAQGRALFHFTLASFSLTLRERTHANCQSLEGETLNFKRSSWARRSQRSGGRYSSENLRPMLN